METPGNKYRFERIEKKFLMSKEQYEALYPRIRENMIEDSHGNSLICNIYYDTPDFALIRNSVERPLFKEKIRVRSYGIPDDSYPVFVELKRKLNGVGYKRRITVPYADALRLMKGESVNSGQEQTEKEILDFVKRYSPEPQVYLTYKRLAFFGKDNPEFRVTTDTELKYRLCKDGFELSDDGENILEDSSMILLEIKSSSAIPEWLLSAMSALNIYQAPFSKIGACYLRHIAPYTVNGTINESNF